MKPLGNILAATDLSAPSRHAVDRGFMVAHETGASLTVAYALDLGLLDELRGLLAGRSEAIVGKLEAQIRDELTDMLAEPDRNRGITASMRIEHGSALMALPAIADAIDVDLLVLGARGEGFLRHMLLGSIASRLIHLTGRPVLVVRQPPRDRYRHVLIPVDFSAASPKLIQIARRVAPSAAITLLHAFDVPFEGKLRYAGVEKTIIDTYRELAATQAEQRLGALAADVGLPRGSYAAIVLQGDPTQHILQQEQERDCDLIVMGKHGASLQNLLLGSVTKHVLSQSQSDVLVLEGGPVTD
ncbi:MAG: universal stress protein [Rhodocyclaceae bacterium]|nr:universal stress protein [Rhodocyclaceae bacterium]MCB1912128.1 universal stress protein [Rhodocyclaceae bacterium]MCP5233973.1 universal stress protein [Zoogloeaceae bacterium]MCP5239079.1 universal stress protein [Zoogloeaceae bacterium]MCW5616339.1 universal stress protein [Rhodocyclaceae bacterium]